MNMENIKKIAFTAMELNQHNTADATFDLMVAFVLLARLRGNHAMIDKAGDMIRKIDKELNVEN